MITDAIINFLLIIPFRVLSLIPAFTFEFVSIPLDVFRGFATLLYGMWYMCPWVALMPIVVAVNTLLTARIAMSMFKFIKGLIPTMGD